MYDVPPSTVSSGVHVCVKAGVCLNLFDCDCVTDASSADAPSTTKHSTSRLLHGIIEYIACQGAGICAAQWDPWFFFGRLGSITSPYSYRYMHHEPQGTASLGSRDTWSGPHWRFYPATQDECLQIWEFGNCASPTAHLQWQLRSGGQIFTYL